jgi:hypothetical protein
MINPKLSNWNIILMYKTVYFCGCNPLLRSCNRILVVCYRLKLYTDSERRIPI